MASPAQVKTLYEEVASRLSAAIATGTLRPGDRLPSVRKLAHQQDVSISTVLQAYLHLESQGLIEARPQSGHYVRARALAAHAGLPGRDRLNPAGETGQNA